MRNMKQRVVALFLSLVMLISMIGVQPIDVSAAATGSTGGVINFGSGTATDAKTYFGVHFLLVPYKSDYYAWRDNKDIKKMTKGKVKMDNNIKKGTKLGKLNYSRYSIYVGIDSKNDLSRKVAIPMWEAENSKGTKYKVLGTTSGNAKTNQQIRSYGWSSIDNIIKKMSGNNKSTISKWNNVASKMKACNKNAISATELSNASSALQSAFNTLESRLVISSKGKSSNQTWLKKTFNSYNATKTRKSSYDNSLSKMYPEENGYYLIVEPVVYIERNGKYLVVSAQDLYGYMSGDYASSKQLNFGFLDPFTEGPSGFTKGAYAASKMDNLSSMLRQKTFKYNANGKVSAVLNDGYYSRSFGHNSFKWYKQGGYACIIPRNSTITPTENFYSVTQVSKYGGQVGSTSAKLTGASSTTMVDSTKGDGTTLDLSSYPSSSGSASIIAGNYLITMDEGSKASNLTTVTNGLNAGLNNTDVSINWARANVSGGTYNLGQRWGVNANSTLTKSNGYDYVMFMENQPAGFSFNPLSNEIEEPDVAIDNGYTDTEVTGSQDAGTDNDDVVDAGEDEDDAEDTEDLGDIVELDVTKLSQNSYVNASGQYGVIDTNINNRLNSVHRSAIDGLKATSSKGKKYVNMVNGYFNDYVPYTSVVTVGTTTVNSYGYQLTYNIENKSLGNGTISSSSNNSNTVSYSTFIDSGAGTGNDSANAGWFKGDNDTLYVVAVRNTFRAGNDAVNYVKSKLNTSSADAFVTSFNNLASDPNLILKAEVEGGDKISVGAESTGSGLTGYTVVFIGIKGDIPLTGDEVLEAYQLNNIDPDMAQSFANAKGNPGLIFKSRTNSTYLYFGNTQTTNHCNIAWSPCLISSTKSYDVRYFDKSNDSSNKYTIKLDNDLQNTYLIATAMDTAYYNIHYRSILKSQGGNYNSSEQPKRKFTYAFNLVRSLFEDKRASSFYPASDTMYANGNTGVVAGELKMQYSNVPPTTVKNATKVRDSQALVGSKLTETIKWTGVYTHMYDNNSDGDMKLASHNNCNCGTAIRHVTNSDWIDDSIKPFKLGNLPMKQAKIIVTEYAKKYQTANIELTAGGTNKNADGILKGSDANNPVSSMKAVDINDDSILDDNTRYAYVEKHNVTGDNITLSFYPEVKMMLYSFTNPQEKIIRNSSSVFRQACYVMGERKRNVQSSSLYLYRVSNAKSAEGVSQKLKGTVYSDDMSTGTAGNGNGNTPVIYAGGNVSMKVDGANLNLNLYGYSVDLINKDKDATMKINATEAITYNSIVADNSDVYSTWGNGTGTAPTESTQLLFTDYKNWVRKMTDSKNYGADVTLKVGTGATQKTYNNFNTTVGKIKYDETTQTKEEGVYPLTIMNGKVFTARQTAHDQSLSRGYWSLVAQIQKDYNCTEAVAVKLLEESKMFDSIYTAIESSVSEFNKSGKIPALTNGTNITNELGNDKNWYDEVVRTFCVRRYVTDTLHIDGTMLSDKIDFDAAPVDNSVSSGVNDRQNAWNTANAKWYVSFYFIGEPNALTATGAQIPAEKRMYGNGTIGSGISVFYNPSDTSGASWNNAKAGCTVLTDKLHVDGADFIVPSATTNDESN